MKAAQFFAATLLGVGFSFSAHAQTPVVGSPGTMSTPGSTTTGMGTAAPGQTGTVLPGSGTGTVIGTGTLPAGTTTPIGTSGTTMSPNGLPTRTIDNGTIRSDQQVNPATPGAQPSRRLNSRTRTTTTGTSTTTRP